VTHSPYALAPDLSVALSRIAVQYLTLIFHQHTEAKDVITSKCGAGIQFSGFRILLREDTPPVRSWIAVRTRKSNLIKKEILTFGEKPNFHGMMLLKIEHHIVKAFGCKFSE
jgi:hypothetical protein